DRVRTPSCDCAPAPTTPACAWARSTSGTPARAARETCVSTQRCACRASHSSEPLPVGFDIRRHVVEMLRRTFDRADLLCLFVADCYTRERRDHVHPRASALFAERHDRVKQSRIAIIAVEVDQTLRLHDLTIGDRV